MCVWVGVCVYLKHTIIIPNVLFYLIYCVLFDYNYRC